MRQTGAHYSQATTQRRALYGFPEMTRHGTASPSTGPGDMLFMAPDPEVANKHTDDAWTEAKRLCKVSAEDIAKANHMPPPIQRAVSPGCVGQPRTRLA